MIAIVFIAILLCIVIIHECSANSISVVGLVRGRRYEVSAETVEEFTKQVETLAGLEAGQQSVLFRGKVLSSSDKLEDAGVSSGDVLNVLKGRKPVGKPTSDEDSSSVIKEDVTGEDAYSEVMKNANPEEMKNAMKAMDNLLDSDFLDEYFGDEEKLEKARQQMLANVDKYDQMMPGFKEQAREIASDPEKWRQAMLNAKEQILKLKKQRDALKNNNQSNDVIDNSRYLIFTYDQRIIKQCGRHRGRRGQGRDVKR